MIIIITIIIINIIIIIMFQARDLCQRPFTRSGAAVRTSGSYQDIALSVFHIILKSSPSIMITNIIIMIIMMMMMIIITNKDDDQGIVTGPTDASEASSEHCRQPCKP